MTVAEIARGSSGSPFVTRFPDVCEISLPLLVRTRVSSMRVNILNDSVFISGGTVFPTRFCITFSMLEFGETF